LAHLCTQHQVDQRQPGRTQGTIPSRCWPTTSNPSLSPSANPLVEQIFQEGRRDILRYLCRQFQLPTFDMHLVLDENDTTNVVLTPSQQLSKLIEEYPDVALLSKQFGLELE
jgi:hypothetical protein